MTERRTQTYGKILILGAGKTGLSLASCCLELFAEGLVESVSLYDERGGEAVPIELVTLQKRGLCIIDRLPDGESICVSGGLPETKVDRSEDKPFDLCIASPGISVFAPVYEHAQRISSEIISEPEFAYRVSPKGWIGITGTNGKTTTTALITHIFIHAGYRATSVGNIGAPAIDAACRRRKLIGAENVSAEGKTSDTEKPMGEVLVAELSSYQLAGVRQFKPSVAVLLNVTPDHIDWHKTHEHYRDSKMKVFAQMDGGDVAVFNVDDPEAARLSDEVTGPSVMRVGLGCKAEASGADCGHDNAETDYLDATVIDGALCVTFQGESHTLCRADELQIQGDHNLINALCAACATFAWGLNSTEIAQGLTSFTAVAHRLQRVARVNGVEYYNDSKATNTDATLAALSAFTNKPVLLLLGGYDKGTDLSKLISVADAQCKKVVLFGAAAQRFAEAFEGSSVEVVCAGTLKEAVQVAASSANEGETVLLSPACASFDEFTSFEHRGDSFISYVQEIEANYSQSDSSAVCHRGASGGDVRG